MTGADNCKHYPAPAHSYLLSQNIVFSRAGTDPCYWYPDNLLA